MRYLLAITALLLLAATLIAQKKKRPEDVTQTLELPKDPPAVALGETRRLVFRVSQLSGKGLLTQQTRDALRALVKENSGMPVVHIRAFVAGSGDIRRVPQIVSEIFDKKQPLPSVSVVLSGGLPLDNAQVVLETVSMSKKEVNPTGLSFQFAEEATDPDPAAPVRPLLDRTLNQLASTVNASDVLAVTCFVTSMNNASDLSSGISARFPGSAIDLVQTQRAPYSAGASCEAVARGTQATAARLAFTGTRVAFGSEEKNAALAFQRLDRDLADAGADPASIVMTHVYPLSRPVAAMVRRLRPATARMALLPFEGLASIDAGFAVDAVAAVK
jgi:enamine deaminase RidA (YjgF/YER057c/UK114 family)